MLYKLLPFVLFLSLSAGCSHMAAPPPGVNKPAARSSHYDDAAIKTQITAQLLKKSALEAGRISVYSYKGHVFFIGEAGDSFRSFCTETAHNVLGTQQVTTHWFPVGSKLDSDPSLKKNLEKKFAFGKNIDLLKTAVDVYGGHVVYTGTLASRQAIDQLLSETKKITGVKRITSYLTIETP